MDTSTGSERRLDNVLYPAKVVAGWISVAFIIGMLWVALGRDLNPFFLSLVALTAAVIATGLVVSTWRRSRRRRLGRSYDASE